MATNTYLLIGLTSVQHFMVDALCICCMYLLAPYFGSTAAVACILTYNVLAFMTQPMTGIWADKLEQRHWLLFASSLLLTLAVVVTSLAPLLGYVPWVLPLVAVLLGMGNSIFHVWGGKQTVLKVGNDIRALGVFVSTGALGLAVGLVYCSPLLLCALLLAIVLLSVAYVRYDDMRREPSVIPEHRNLIEIGKPYPLRDLSLPLLCVAVVLLMLFVAYRSFAGEMFSKGISKTDTLILILGFVSMLGKMAGGWIARSMGVIRSLAVVLAGVALCFLFRGDFVLVLLLGVFLMNCTMPVTLYLANEVLSGREGMAFGLMAAALIPGWLLATYG